MRLYTGVLVLIGLAFLAGCAAPRRYAKPTVIPKIEPARPVVVPRTEVIVLDPGHGGEAKGAVGPAGLKEKDVVLDIANRLKGILGRRGYTVYLTRTDDYDVSLEKRKDCAGEYGADLFISIHCDANKKRQVGGTAAYILSDKGAVVVKERALTDGDYILANNGPQNPTNDYAHEAIVDLTMDGCSQESYAFAKLAVSCLTDEIGTKSLGVKRAAFAVLKNPNVPSCLVEVAFISNHWEEKMLKRDDTRDAIAGAIAKAVDNYFEER